MPKIIRHSLSSLTNYMEIVQNLQHRARHPLWFRGITNSAHSLIPSLYRHPKTTAAPDLNKLEQELLTRFRQRSIPYRTRDLSDDWEALFLCSTTGYRRDCWTGRKSKPQTWGTGISRFGSKPSGYCGTV
ncbi:FRG domain-containing protein [Bradyrhizobium sp. RDM4]|uniref:FRG domain-containing protein n=1 Tax=Bradyrhizobium sp. RDM4 TaxID=3378765 RepID=UPI0038FC0BB5